jgi:HEAT repeat protein
MLLDLGPELAEKAVLAYYHDPDQGIHGKARDILKTFQTTEAAIFDQAVVDLDHAVAHQRALAVQTILAAPVDPTKRKEVALALDRAVARNEAVASGGAMMALKKWGTVDNVPTLVKQLKSKVEQARQVAMEALGEIKDPTGAEETAKLLLVNSGLVQDRQNAQKALIAMGAIAEQATLPYLSNRDAGVRLAACKVLESIGTKASVAALTTAAAQGPGEVTQAARDAIAAIQKR